jgi:hypothetical protein
VQGSAARVAPTELSLASLRCPLCIRDPRDWQFGPTRDNAYPPASSVLLAQEIINISLKRLTLYTACVVESVVVQSSSCMCEMSAP